MNKGALLLDLGLLDWRRLVFVQLACVVGFLGGSYLWDSFRRIQMGSNPEVVQEFTRSQAGVEERYYLESSERDTSIWALAAYANAPLNLFSFFEFYRQVPSEIIGHVAIGQIISGPHKGYAVQVRTHDSKDYSFALEQEQFLRVTITTVDGRNIRYEDLNADGVFEVRLETSDARATQLELWRNGEWINVEIGLWGSNEPLRIVGSENSLEWDGSQWQLTEN